jgi:hypothetical protein
VIAVSSGRISFWRRQQFVKIYSGEELATDLLIFEPYDPGMRRAATWKANAQHCAFRKSHGGRRQKTSCGDYLDVDHDRIADETAHDRLDRYTSPLPLATLRERHRVFKAESRARSRQIKAILREAIGTSEIGRVGHNDRCVPHRIEKALDPCRVAGLPLDLEEFRKLLRSLKIEH